MRRRHLVRFLHLAVATLLVASLSQGAFASNKSRLMSPATDQNGHEQSWQRAEGGLLVVDFAADWCGPCHTSLPRLQHFADTHPGVEVLVVSVDQKIEGRDALVESLDLRVPVLWDQDHQIAEHYRPTAMPHTVVVDSDGKVLRRLDGSKESEWEELARWIEERSTGE